MPTRSVPSWRLLALVRAATRAASSHNTQPWTFHAAGHHVTIAPDLTRRCPVVDPDDHHLFASLGCAAENLVQAARADGIEPRPLIDPASGVITLALESTRASASPLARAIPARQVTRGPYDGRPIESVELTSLVRAGESEGIHLLLLTDRPRIEQALEYIVAANRTQLADAAFLRELKAWVRFNARHAAGAGDGLSYAASGNPSIPTWIGRAIFRMVVRPGAENDKTVRQVRSSGALAVFVSEQDDRPHWIEAGRCYERLALQATALGLRNAFLNQPVEVPELRAEFAAWLGIGARRPDLVVRLGHGAEMPRSPRRPLEEVFHLAA
jgi:nitroreductase